jgi:ABC-type dipeptide/oligopeptide/nickel transport system permease component
MDTFIPYVVGFVTGLWLGVVVAIKRPQWFRKF